MDRAVETIIRENQGRIRPGDVYAINAPYNGGTHLPDITICTPVFDDRKKSILFWVASRGHHADVGGISPGSMSPNATTIEQEGVLFDNFKLIDRGRFREKELMAALTEIKYPARNPVQNINDIKAQIAANEKGVAELRKMVTHFTLPVVKAYMEPGRLSPQQLIADIADGFYVTDLIGVGANMVTGDYSRGASGFWIENGKRTYPVSEVTIAGHLIEMFRTLTPANDLEFRFGINAPTLRVEGLTVAGQ